MKNNLESLWSGFSSSIIGSGHIKRGLPCQDASATVTAPRPALIVCDGRGSASRSQDGASGAVGDFITQCAVFEPMLASILDADKADAGRWEMFCRIIYRTLMQTKLDLARDHGVPEKEFDFTVAASVVGTHWIGCFQVGDGSIVLRQNGTPQTAFLPDKGEFANQTHFLRKNGEARGGFHAKLFSAKENSGIAITSDGPEHLMFHLATMTPGSIFNMLFDDMQSRSLTRQDIMDYLTRREWDKDPRGQDDRSIAILAPQLRLPESESAPDAFHNSEKAVTPRPEEETTDDEPTSETAPAPRDEAEPLGESVAPTSPVREATCREPHGDAETDCKEESQHVSTVSRNVLISRGVTGAAIILLLLSLVYGHSEIRAMRQHLNVISAQKTIDVEEMRQLREKTAEMIAERHSAAPADDERDGFSAASGKDIPQSQESSESMSLTDRTGTWQEANLPASDASVPLEEPDPDDDGLDWPRRPDTGLRT